MRRLQIFLALILLCAAASQASAATVELKDGSVLYGTIVARHENYLILAHATLGRIQIDLASIVEISGEEISLEPVEEPDLLDRSLWLHDPDHNSVMLGPTPETIGKGHLYLRNFELFYLNTGIGMTENLDLSFGFLFPVSASFNVVSAGLKYRLLSRERSPIGLAATVSGTIAGDLNVGNAGIIAGLGDDRASLNVTVLRGVREEVRPGHSYIISADRQISRGSKLIAEFSSGLSGVLPIDDDEDVNGFLNFGFRWFGNDWSFSLTGIRPLGLGNDEGFLAFPLAMFSRTL